MKWLGCLLLVTGIWAKCEELDLSIRTEVGSKISTFEVAKGSRILIKSLNQVSRTELSKENLKFIQDKVVSIVKKRTHQIQEFCPRAFIEIYSSQLKKKNYFCLFSEEPAARDSKALINLLVQI